MVILRIRCGDDPLQALRTEVSGAQYATTILYTVLSLSRVSSMDTHNTKAKRSPLIIVCSQNVAIKSILGTYA